ncbi:MAG: ACP S-malonyltransferase [Actinomycetales bacterium]|nr:ACP S-malonyltransferase [Actinomycetales bacterium]
MLALLFPGQGSQTPGMLAPWLNDETKKLVATWSLHIDLDLERLGTTASADEIKDTANAQPLIVAAGLLGAEALGLNKFSVVAGHSVGEITAAGISGVLSPAHALELVRQRGIAMAKAASQVETGMAAVLGGERTEVLKSIKDLDLVPANDNGAGQIVAAGSLAQIDKLIENPPAGSRVRALAVAGAFHSHYMQSAVSHVAGFVEKVSINEPTSQLLSNKDGSVVAGGKDAIDRIVNQIANPVRWDLCMESLVQLGVTGAIEFPPAGTLVGLLKRATPGIETFALKSPEDLAAAKEFAAKHGGA